MTHMLHPWFTSFYIYMANTRISVGKNHQDPQQGHGPLRNLRAILHHFAMEGGLTRFKEGNMSTIHGGFQLVMGATPNSWMVSVMKTIPSRN